MESAPSSASACSCPTSIDAMGPSSAGKPACLSAGRVAPDGQRCAGSRCSSTSSRKHGASSNAASPAGPGGRPWTRFARSFPAASPAAPPTMPPITNERSRVRRWSSSTISSLRPRGRAGISLVGALDGDDVLPPRAARGRPLPPHDVAARQDRHGSEDRAVPEEQPSPGPPPTRRAASRRPPRGPSPAAAEDRSSLAQEPIAPRNASISISS